MRADDVLKHADFEVSAKGCWLHTCAVSLVRFAMFLITTPWRSKCWNWMGFSDHPHTVGRERDMQYPCDRTALHVALLVTQTPFFVVECCFCLCRPGSNVTYFTYLFNMKCNKMHKSWYYCGLRLHENFHLQASGQSTARMELKCPVLGCCAITQMGSVYAHVKVTNVSSMHSHLKEGARRLFCFHIVLFISFLNLPFLISCHFVCWCSYIVLCF
jgi:hypothetical protein